MVTSCLNNILSLCLQFTSTHHNKMVCSHIKSQVQLNPVLSTTFCIKIFFNFYMNSFPKKRAKSVDVNSQQLWDGNIHQNLNFFFLLTLFHFTLTHQPLYTAYNQPNQQQLNCNCILVQPVSTRKPKYSCWMSISVGDQLKTAAQ